MSMDARPNVTLVGGPDVDARLDLMRVLRTDFNLSALGSEPGLRDKFAADGFAYYAYGLSRKANPAADVLTLLQLARLFRRLKPQIVHAFDTKPGVWGCLAARWAGVPVVIGTLTGLGSLYASEGLRTRLIRAVYQTLQKWACSVSDLSIFQNYQDAREFVDARVVPAGKAAVILGSGVSTATFAPGRVSEAQRVQLRDELGIRPGEVVVTMISRVIRSKGVLEFMTAAQAVTRSQPGVRFLLVGPGDQESVDRLTAAELSSLRQSITWPGARRDIPVVLALSDIFVLPSSYREGIPRVLLEAAAMALPIVTTDSPGCNDVVEDGVNGLLVPVLDAGALGRAIARLVADSGMRGRFGQVSRQRAVERFDLDVIAAQTRSVYARLLVQRAGMRGPLVLPAEVR